MQRVLALERTPALPLPLRFLLAAPWFGVLAGALLLWQGDAVLVSRWAPSTLALTHLITLGHILMAIVGSLVQMLPVVASLEVPGAVVLGSITWPALMGGTVLLAAAFLTMASPLFGVAGALLCTALLTVLGCFGRALARPCVTAGARALVTGTRLAMGGLAVAGVLGLVLAAFLARVLQLPALWLADVHAAWGLIGCVTLLVGAVSFQVVPMFQSTDLYPERWMRRGARAVGALLLTWSVLYGLGWPAAAWGADAVAVLLAAYSLLTLKLLARRRRGHGDAGSRYWQFALAALLVSAAMYVWPGAVTGPRALTLGVVLVAGFVLSVVNGMLYRIVPFLAWYHREQQAPRRGRGPKLSQLLDADAPGNQLRWHALAVLALAVAPWCPVALARPAGLMFMLASARLGLDLIGPVRMAGTYGCKAA